MKKLVFNLLLLGLLSLVLYSCADSKRDCNGVKHYKQKGGFYMYM